ncbi:MAG: DUF1127 domain-containing protein [Devosia sp.]
MNAFFSTLMRHANKRRTCSEMLRLDDHLLRDIGVTRAELRAQMANVQFADLVGAHARG